MLDVKPILRWAGSKRKLNIELAQFWSSKYCRYIEPFAGSAFFFFKLQPQSAILSDINVDLISAYEQIKLDSAAVADLLSTFKISSEQYYRLRSLDPNSLSPLVRAARFIYLNRFCFNGLYRTNRQGQFNVPYGGKKTGRLPNAEELNRCQQLLSRATLITGDFSGTLALARKGDFVYMDPPYATSKGRVFNEYDAKVFCLHDIEKLRYWMDKFTKLQVVFVVSYADCPEAKTLSRGYKTKKVEVRRNIAGFSGSRRLSSEVLITNKMIVS